jgi:putative transposase
MTNIRRYFEPNQICFLTHVTHNRLPILIPHAALLMDCLTRYLTPDRCDLLAWSILPDHLHLLVKLGTGDIATIMKRMKLSFSSRYRLRTGMTAGRVWQYRYWDRIIRTEDELKAAFDYIHFNPVKHGIVGSPFDWEYSSAREYLEVGFYANDWECMRISASDFEMPD